MRKSFSKLVKVLILPLVLALSITNPVLADAGEVPHEEKTVDGYKVELSFAEGEVQFGHNKLHVKISDPQGQLVTNAVVTVIAELYEEVPAGATSAGGGGMNMGSPDNGTGDAPKPIKTVKEELTAGTDAGEYEGEVDLSQSGHWMITTVFKTQQQEKSVEFEIEVQKGGPNWYVLSGFFGVILAFIVGGIITAKRKSAKALAAEEVR